MLDLKIVKVVTLDLDDTLWPVWPVIVRAEKALEVWLQQKAPLSAALFANPASRLELREHISQTRPELGHNLSAIRREAIRLALSRSREDPLLADDAFEVFFAERNRVVLFEDALPALAFLSARYPVVALSNGNADVGRVGIGQYFKASISAQQFGVGKPDVRIFHAASGAVGATPEETLHIGDDASLDVLGGLKAGMQTVWLNRSSDPWTHPDTPHVTVASLTALCELMLAAEAQQGL